MDRLFYVAYNMVDNLPLAIIAIDLYGLSCAYVWNVWNLIANVNGRKEIGKETKNRVT